MATRRISWWKFHNDNMDILTEVPDAEIGKAVKLCMKYFDNKGSLPDEDIPQEGMLRVAFLMMKRGVDESLNDYARQSEAGKRGASRRAMNALVSDEEREKLLDEMSEAEDDLPPIDQEQIEGKPKASKANNGKASKGKNKA